MKQIQEVPEIAENKFIGQHSTLKFKYDKHYGWVAQYKSVYSTTGSNVRLVCNKQKLEDEFELHPQMTADFEKGFYVSLYIL